MRKSKRTSKMPADYQLSAEMLEWIKVKVPDINAGLELEMIRDHEFRTPYSDWDAVCRNWFRKAQRTTETRRKPFSFAAPVRLNLPTADELEAGGRTFVPTYVRK